MKLTGHFILYVVDDFSSPNKGYCVIQKTRPVTILFIHKKHYLNSWQKHLGKWQILINTNITHKDVILDNNQTRLSLF